MKSSGKRCQCSQDEVLLLRDSGLRGGGGGGTGWTDLVYMCFLGSEI